MAANLKDMARKLAYILREVFAGLFAWPFVIVAASAVAGGLLASIRGWPAWGQEWLGSVASAQYALSSVANAMMSTAGITFSVVMIALTLISNQFSPRVLRTFTEDRVSQVTLGVLVGNFLYTEVLLLTLREDALPVVGIFGCMLYTLVATGVFVYFIHHIAEHIQVSSLIQGITLEARAVIRRCFERGHLPSPVRPRLEQHLVDREPLLRACRTGYIQRVDLDRLVALAREHDLCLRLAVDAGDYLAPHVELVEEALPQDVEELVRSCLLTGPRRTMTDDPSFAFRELADVAIKAISPAINDPTTACNCIDAMAGLLVELIREPWPNREVRDSEGVVRVVFPESCFKDYLELALGQLRHYGAREVNVVLRLLDLLLQLRRESREASVTAAVQEQLERVMEDAREALEGPSERRRLHDAAREISSNGSSPLRVSV